jgi:regulatory protein
LASPTLDSRDRALDLAFRYLGPRDRTVAETRRYLEGKRVDPAAITAAVAELAEQGYLDDARYAQRFAEDRRELDDWGAERIERRLLAAGVDPDLVAAALAQQAAEDELAAAVAQPRARRTRAQGLRERPRARGGACARARLLSPFAPQRRRHYHQRQQTTRAREGVKHEQIHRIRTRIPSVRRPTKRFSNTSASAAS